MRLTSPVATLTIEAELLPLVREVLGRGGHLPLLARGDSMCPAICNGDRLLLGPLEDGQVRVGDVVLWSASGRSAIHRVLQVDGDRVMTSGDALAGCDGWLSREAILCRVASVRRRNLFLRLGHGLRVRVSRRSARGR